MQLSAWFSQQKGMTQEALARRVGVTQGRIAQLMHGQLPSMTLAARIQEITKGAVTPNDFLLPEKRHRRAL